MVHERDEVGMGLRDRVVRRRDDAALLGSELDVDPRVLCGGFLEHRAHVRGRRAVVDEPVLPVPLVCARTDSNISAGCRRAG